MAPWTATIREKGRAKSSPDRGAVSPPSKESDLLAPYYLRGPVFQKTSNGFFSGAFDSLYFRGLEKGKRQNESLQGAAVDPAVFAHPIVYSQ
jgi:hypothetical protein